MQNFGHYVPAELLTELHEIYTHGHLFVDDLGDLIAHHSTYVEQFYLLFPDCTERHRALSFFSKLPYFVTTAGYTDMEITHLQATKGMALATLAKHLGLRRENVIALGDSKNDLSALEYAGIAVVMENGSDDLKRAADIIAPSNEIGGVADILEMIIHGVL